MKLNCISIFHYFGKKYVLVAVVRAYSLILWIFFTVAYMINGFLKEIEFYFHILIAVRILLLKFLADTYVYSISKIQVFYVKLFFYILEIKNLFLKKKSMKRISEFFIPFCIGQGPR